MSSSSDASGVTQKPVVIASGKKEVSLTIPTGSRVTTDRGETVSDISVSQEVASAAQDDVRVVGFSTMIGQDGMTLDKLSTLTLKIDMTKLSAGSSASDLAIAKFDTRTQKWVVVVSVVDLANGTATAQISELGEYAIIDTSSHGLDEWLVIGLIIGVLAIAGLVFALARRKKIIS